MKDTSDPTEVRSEATPPIEPRAEWLGDARVQRGWQVSLLIATLMSLVGIVSLILALINRAGVASTIPVFFIAAAAWVSLIFVRQGKVESGVRLIVASVILAELALAVITEGLGVLIALVSLAVIAGVTSVTFGAAAAGAGRGVRPEIVTGSLAAVAVILFDLYGPAMGDPGNPLLTNLLVGIIILFSLAIILVRFRAFPLRTKLLLAALVISLGPFLLFSWLNVNRLTALLESTAESELVTLAAQVSRIIDTFVENNLNNVRIQAQLPGFSDYLSLPEAQRQNSMQETNVTRALSSLLRSDTVFITSIGLLDIQGKIALDTAVEEIGAELRDQDYFAEVMRTGLPYMSPVRIDPISGEPSLFFAAPVRNASREIVGVLRIRYRASILQSLLVNSVGRDANQGYAVLVDSEYFIRLAHSGDPALILKAYAPLEPDVTTRLQAEGRLFDQPIEETATDQPVMVQYLRNIAAEPMFTTGSDVLGGREAFSAAQVVGKTPWIVITRQPVDVIQTPIQSQARSSVTLALATVGLVALVATLGSQTLTAPITQLTRAAERVALGDLSVRSSIVSDDEIGVLSTTFDSMAIQLQQILQGLEQRVAERTRAIELSVDVSRRLSTILDPSQLVTEVVQLLQNAFNYYHVHIYLLDEAAEKLIMAGGTGEAGQEMLARGHFILVGRGLVGRAASTGAPVLVSDTRQEPDWLANPLLPETQSEAAVPIIFGEQILGVLDVQQNRVEGLGAQDLELLASIANQLAIALRNSRQLVEIQNRAEVEAKTAEIIRQIQDARTIESALQVAVRELGRALGTPHSAVTLQVERRPGELYKLAPVRPEARGGNGKSLAETTVEEK